VLNLLWLIVAVLIVLWLLGLTVTHIGGIVWLLLVIAAIVALFNLFSGNMFSRN
jgi:hypothetical protein